MSAVEQIVTAPVTRDIAWLRQALQSAIALEHSTLPLYTAAMLSLEVQNYPTYNTIRSVLMEEMVHMATAANMLAAIGGTPDIKRLDPRYPRQGLPGGVEPDLVRLHAQLKNDWDQPGVQYVELDETLPKDYPFEQLHAQRSGRSVVPAQTEGKRSGKYDRSQMRGLCARCPV